MLKNLIIGSALALGLAFGARAQTLQPAPREALPDDVVGVEAHHSAGGAIIGDAIGGMVLGAAVGGGVAFYNREQNGNWGNWQRDLLIGGGIGLGVGLIFGAADAASSSDRTYVTGPVADQRTVGFSPPTTGYAMKF